MMPLVVKEDSVRTFKFYSNGTVQRGMICENRLYKLVSAFDSADCPVAYALGWSLGHSGSQAVITLANEKYGVWVDLRSH